MPTRVKESSSYNAINRLLTANCHNSRLEEYENTTTYQPSTGNIATKDENTYSYLSGTPHATESADNADGIVGSFTCDQNGNMLSLAWEQDLKTFSYNEEGKLISFVFGGGANYLYDGDGNKVMDQVSEGNRTFHMGNYLEKHQTIDSWTVKEYIHADGVRIAMRINVSDTFWFHDDHLGGTNKVTREIGNVSTTVLYTPWGEVRYEQGEPVTDRLYTDQPRMDDNPNLYYYGAKWLQVNRDLFSDGRMILFERIKQDLLDGYIKTLP